MRRLIKQALEIWPLYVIFIGLIALLILAGGCSTIHGIGEDLTRLTQPYMKG